VSIWNSGIYGRAGLALLEVQPHTAVVTLVNASRAAGGMYAEEVWAG